MKQIYFLRHAEKSINGEAKDIILSDKGVRQADELGRWLNENDVQIEHVLCSTAVRTRQTLASLEQHNNYPKIEFSDRLYGGSVGDVLACIHDVQDTVKRILIIGHEPGIPQTLRFLSSPDTMNIVGWNGGSYPVCTLSMIETDAKKWADIQPQNNRLALFRLSQI